MKKIMILCSVLSVMISITAQNGIQLGERAPFFSGVDNRGRTVDLADLVKQKAVVLFFYRGQWCPHCNRYLSAIEDSLEMILNRGAEVIAITPEKPLEIDKSIVKTRASFPLVWDEDHEIMDLYKVTFKLGAVKRMAYRVAGININLASGNSDNALPVPATFIIDQSGVVIGRHFETDYKDRMTVKEIVEILDNRIR